MSGWGEVGDRSWTDAPEGSVLMPGTCVARDADGQGCVGIFAPSEKVTFRLRIVCFAQLDGG